jgi:hypothetical protein
VAVKKKSPSTRWGIAQQDQSSLAQRITPWFCVGNSKWILQQTTFQMYISIQGSNPNVRGLTETLKAGPVYEDNEISKIASFPITILLLDEGNIEYSGIKICNTGRTKSSL